MRNTEEIWRLVDAKAPDAIELADRVWGMRQGARAYLTKPFSEVELADMISKVMGDGTPTAPQPPAAA